MQPSRGKTSGNLDNELSVPSIEQQLEKILASEVFARSERMRRFLRFIVEQTLKGEEETLKEYAIALAVFDKPNDFDPRLDPIVRVEAGRLRSKLREYYMTQGRDDPVGLRCPKRSYVPLFEVRRRPSNTPFRTTADPPSTGQVLAADQTGSMLRTPHGEAYPLYLKGRYFWNKRTEEGLQRAIRYFEQSLAVDPDYGLAYAGLADCYAAQVEFGAIAPAQGWSKVDEAIEKSLNIDQKLSQAQALLGAKKALFEWDWAGAEESFQLAIQLNPANSGAHQTYSIYCLAPQRRLEQALVEIERACELDPMWPAVHARVGWLRYLRRQFVEALEQWQRTIELDPTFYLAYLYQGFTYEHLHRFDQALASFTQAQLLSGGAPLTTSALARCYGLMGNQREASRLLTRLLDLSNRRHVSAFDVAGVYLGLGKLDSSFQWLDTACEARCCRLAYLKVDPAWDRLKCDSRLIGLLTKVRLAN